MKILLAGGSGYIGRALCALLQAQHHEVIVLSRAPEMKSQPGSLTYVHWDGIHTQGWGHLAGEVDAIVNLAGENLSAGRWTKARLEAILSSRLQAGRALLEAVRQAEKKPAVFFQASAVGYYGNQEDRRMSEEDAPGQDTLARIAVPWEASTRPVIDLGVRWLCGRTGIVLSKESKALSPLLLQNRLFVGGPLGSGRQWWSWITLADEVRAILYLLENSQARGVYNLVAPEAVTMQVLGKTLSARLRRPYWLPVPGFMLRLVMGQMSTLVLDGQRVSSDKLTKLGFRFEQPTLPQAFEAIL